MAPEESSLWYLPRSIMELFSAVLAFSTLERAESTSDSYCRSSILYSACPSWTRSPLLKYFSVIDPETFGLITTASMDFTCPE